MMKAYMGQGTVTLSVSYDILGENIDNAYDKLVQKINDIATQEVYLELLNDIGDVNQLRVNGLSVNWEEVNEIDKSNVKKPKNKPVESKEASLRSYIMSGKIDW